MNKIKILGYDYVIHTSRPSYDGGMDSAGTCNPGRQIIVLDPQQCKQSQESTILHEMIEALNFHLALSLSHPVIMQLEAGLYQALTDNGVKMEALLKK